MDNVPDTAATFDLRVSRTADRAASEDLQSATLRGNHVIFLEGDPAGVERVEFAMDGRVVRTEWAAPWTFGGGFLNANRVEPFDSRTAGNGEHSISAIATLADGSTVTVTDTFQVDKNAPLL